MYEKTINIAALESVQADIPTCNIIPSAEMFKSGPGGTLQARRNLFIS